MISFLKEIACKIISFVSGSMKYYQWDVCLNIDQAQLDKHKSEIVKDTNHKSSLEHLQGLPADPDIKIPFVDKFFKVDDF